MNACCRGCGFVGVPRPSSVTTFRPATEETGRTHDRTAAPSRCTVHAPHCPSPQPKRGPRSARSSRSAYKSGICGSSVEIDAGLPLRWNEILIDSCSPAGALPPAHFNPQIESGTPGMRTAEIASTIVHDCGGNNYERCPGQSHCTVILPFMVG